MIDFKQFILAGNSTFTIRSKATDLRFTFKVRQPEDDSPHFVSLLTGQDNENDYQYLGVIFPDGNFVVTKNSRISKDAPSAKAFTWLWDRIKYDWSLDQIEYWHEGRCCSCGRKLTTPHSVELGIGPVCAAGL
jgi:hypothetical protein